jgi:hypothetical protein
MKIRVLQIRGMLCVNVQYSGTKLANSLIRPIVAELGLLSSDSTSGGLITIVVSGFGGKILISGGAWLGVKSFGIPYRGFFNSSHGAKEPDDCGLPGTLYGSEDMLNVLIFFTKPSSNMYFNRFVICLL